MMAMSAVRRTRLVVDILLCKGSKAAGSRPKLARMCSSSGGAAASTAETVVGEAAPGSAAVDSKSATAVNDRFRHLPGLQVRVSFTQNCARGLCPGVLFHFNQHFNT